MAHNPYSLCTLFSIAGAQNPETTFPRIPCQLVSTYILLMRSIHGRLESMHKGKSIFPPAAVAVAKAERLQVSVGRGSPVLSMWRCSWLPVQWPVGGSGGGAGREGWGSFQNSRRVVAGTYASFCASSQGAWLFL